MSRFFDHVLDLSWAAAEGVVDRLKFLSSSLVEDDEYILIFVLCLGVPAVVVLIFIARYIRRTHDRVRYAAEYVERDPQAFVTSSSSATDSNDESSSSDAERAGGSASRRRFTMEEVAAASQRLTAQETVRRRTARRAAEAQAAAEAAAAEAEAEPSSSPTAAAEISDKKND